MTRLRAQFAALKARSPELVGGAWLNLGLLLVMLLGLAFDHRVVTGAPVWLKPVKFASSIAVFLLSIAWMVQMLPPSVGVRRASKVIAWLLTLEVFLIGMQAARGTASHFNADTAFDGAVFTTMGVAIGVVWLASMYILWRHWRTPATDRALALAFRVGLALNIVGAGIGWRMTQPTAVQLEALSQGVRPRVIGAHTVGAPDGGAGMPVTMWSKTHGDLRVPHFVGMHALQWLPLLVLGLRAVRAGRNDFLERAAVRTASAVSLLLFFAVLAQALRGKPLITIVWS